MEIIKEFVKQNRNDTIRIIIRTDCYCHSLNHLNDLSETQRDDFVHHPSSFDQKVIHYGGRSYKGTWGIEANVPIDTVMPDGYEERENVEYSL